ncbi:MAG: riboflavin synthase [Bacteroidales bacterium]
MFTGIVEEIGTIKEVVKGARSIQLTVSAKKITSDIKLGDSISTNGICLTVTSFGSDYFIVDVMPESLKRTSLSGVRPGVKVNLERALCLSDRLGGHLVSGHIDGQGTIVAINKDDNAVWFTIKTEPSILKYIVEKGSVAIDGISLTVAYVDEVYFKVSIIPHTIKETILQYKHEGDSVNLENDITAKYIEKFLLGKDTYCKDGSKQKNQVSKSGLNMDFLTENGFA